MATSLHNIEGLPHGALLRAIAAHAGLPPGALLRPLTGSVPRSTKDVPRGTGAESAPLKPGDKRADIAPSNAHAIESITSHPDLQDEIESANLAAPKPIGQKESESNREVLQPSDHPAVNQALATAAHPKVKAALEGALKNVQGAKLSGHRETKPVDRLAEKVAGEDQPSETIPDYSGFRVSVDMPKAHRDAVHAIRGALPVVREKDEFDKGSAEERFHAHMLQVQGENGATHEVQVLPKEVAETVDDDHDLYEKARAGDKGAQSQLKEKNDANWQKWLVRTSNEGGKDEAPKYKFGNTQAHVPPGSDAHKAIEKTRAKVAPADLAGKGKDIDGNHVTVRYGIQGDDTAELKKYLATLTPFEVKLKKTDAFPPSESSDGAAVIKAGVESPDLHRINGEIEKHADFKKSDFPDYKPHVTIAYVKPEAAAKYTGLPETEGKTFPVKSIAITDRNGNAEEVPLRGNDVPKQSNSERKGGRGESPEPPRRGAVKAAPAPVKSSSLQAPAAEARSYPVGGECAGPGDRSSHRQSASRHHRPFQFRRERLAAARPRSADRRKQAERGARGKPAEGDTGGLETGRGMGRRRRRWNACEVRRLQRRHDHWRPDPGYGRPREADAGGRQKRPNLHRAHFRKERRTGTRCNRGVVTAASREGAADYGQERRQVHPDLG
jgi:2'-5' RNA ligase